MAPPPRGAVEQGPSRPRGVGAGDRHRSRGPALFVWRIGDPIEDEFVGMTRQAGPPPNVRNVLTAVYLEDQARERRASGVRDHQAVGWGTKTSERSLADTSTGSQANRRGYGFTGSHVVPAGVAACCCAGVSPFRPRAPAECRTSPRRGLNRPTHVTPSTGSLSQVPIRSSGCG